MSSLAPLPPPIDLETKPVLRQAAKANRRLAELKGISESIPNQAVLISTLSLQEAKDSSAVENIITTHDKIYREKLFPGSVADPHAKEVHNYAEALLSGFKLVQDNEFLSANHIISIQAILEPNKPGIRKIPGTALVNPTTGETIYTPPQHPDTIIELLSNLEKFINDDELYDVDPLIKMALAHYQFESIHPFYDGNGRTGRIINVLYLVLKKLLSIPVLYLSRHIITTKPDYYRLLQAVRDEEAWEEWLLYMLTAVENTSLETIRLVRGIRTAMQDYKHRIRAKYRWYSQDLINNLFRHPYTKIESVQTELGVSRGTATAYLNALVKDGFLQKNKIGRSNFYINLALWQLLIPEGEE